MKHSYLFNMRDGRVVLFTKQIAKNADYRPITSSLAHQIAAGEVAAADVMRVIQAKLFNDREAWEEILKRKALQNVRHSELTLEDSEGLETRPDPDEKLVEFDMPQKQPAAPSAEAPSNPVDEAAAPRRKSAKQPDKAS